MRKTGPISQLKKTKREIRSLLLEKPSLSVREIREHIKDKGVPSSYQKIKQALEEMIKLEEVTVTEALADRGSIPKKVYRLKDKGIKEAQKTVMVSGELRELKKLSRDEMILRLVKYHIIKKHESLPPPQGIRVLEELAKQGDPVAAKKLKAVKEDLEELRRFDKEVAEAHPDKRFKIIMKYKRELNRSEQGYSDSS